MHTHDFIDRQLTSGPIYKYTRMQAAIQETSKDLDVIGVRYREQIGEC
jgi:hypothetical protein